MTFGICDFGFWIAEMNEEKDCLSCSGYFSLISVRLQPAQG
jgi:hypothetical protein